MLGSEDVDPLSVAGAFAAFANQGTFCTPRSITGVTVLLGDVDTPLRNVPGPNCKPELDPGIANGVTTLLEHVLLPGGTGGGLDVGRQAAAKTGTDDDYKNAWFSGYTPNLAASVWVGNPDSTTPMRGITVNGKAIPRVFGATLPGPIWQLAMKGALQNLPVETFQAASDLVLRGPPITMPNVVGQDPVDATPTLTALGLVVTPIAGATQVVSTQPQGKIDSTVPAAGTIVYAGQIVKLLISSGVPPPHSDAHRHPAGVIAARPHPVRLIEPVANVPQPRGRRARPLRRRRRSSRALGRSPGQARSPSPRPVVA